MWASAFGQNGQTQLKEGALMLVLTRKIGERIVIGDNIELIVLQATAGRVRFGVAAPAEVPIHRAEVAVRTQAECGVGATGAPSHTAAWRPFK